METLQKNQARRLLSKIYVQFDARKKKLSCAQSLEWPFELGFREQILKILEDNSEHFRAFWETLFESERAKESPEIYFRAKSFRTIFEKRAPVYSLAAPLLEVTKSIYYGKNHVHLKMFIFAVFDCSSWPLVLYFFLVSNVRLLYNCFNLSRKNLTKQFWFQMW